MSFVSNLLNASQNDCAYNCLSRDLFCLASLNGRNSPVGSISEGKFFGRTSLIFLSAIALILPFVPSSRLNVDRFRS